MHKPPAKQCFLLMLLCSSVFTGSEKLVELGVVALHAYGLLMVEEFKSSSDYSVFQEKGFCPFGLLLSF